MKYTDRLISSVTSICGLVSIALTIAGYSGQRSDTTIRQEITGWIKDHPVMANRTIAKIQTHPNAATPGAVSVVSLAPTGTVVVNRDTRLPMVVVFTPDTTFADNVMFDEHVANAAANLKTLGPNEIFVGVKPTTSSTSDLYVPAMLKTDWGQWAPFNLQMPYNPAMKGPAVTGCGTIAMTQILNYYQWPPYGEGSKTHTDTAGAFNPTISSNFDRPFRWDLMNDHYNGDETGPSGQAVAQVVYDVAVLSNVDCETNVSGVNIDITGNNFVDHLFYETRSIINTDWASRYTIESCLKTGSPVPAGITINQLGWGHAVVFDGLLIHKGTTSYHINYGWGAAYNFWWDQNALLDVLQAKESIRPALIPLPTHRNLVGKQGEPQKLPWKIAAIRKADAKQLNLYHKVVTTGTWIEDCEQVPAKVTTWTIDPAGLSGSCWKVNGTYSPDYLTIGEEFVPTKNSTIEFQEKHVCADNYVQIEASVAGGEFKPIFTIGKEVRNTWESQSVSLAGFAEKPVKLRLSYFAPPFSSYYSNEHGGGIWIDNLRVTDTLVKSWELLDTIAGQEIQNLNGNDAFTNHPTLTGLALGTHTLSASLTGQDNYEQRIGSEFTLTLTQTGEVEKLENFQVLAGNKAKPSGTALKLGSTQVGTEKTMKLVIRNTGTTTIRGIQVKTLGPDRKEFTATAANATLAPGASTSVTIQFKPRQAGTRTAEARINTESGGSFKLKISGKGIK